MILNQLHDRGVDIVEIEGRLTLIDVAEAREKLKGIAQSGNGKMVIDLAKTTFMDSGGLSVLISVFKVIQAREGRLVLSSPSSGIQSLIELTRLQHVFEIFQSTETAVSVLSKS